MKLTNEQRDLCIKQCIAATFAKREAAYETMRTRLADALYDLAYGSVEKTVLKLPKEWYSLILYIDVYGPGFRQFISQPGANSSLKMSKPRPAPPHASPAPCWQLKDGIEHPLREPFEAVAREHEKIEAAKTALRNDLKSLLYSATTLAKLEEVWPQGRKFFPVEEKKYPVPVPYDLAKKVSATMGLK